MHITDMKTRKIKDLDYIFGSRTCTVQLVIGPLMPQAHRMLAEQHKISNIQANLISSTILRFHHQFPSLLSFGFLTLSILNYPVSLDPDPMLHVQVYVVYYIAVQIFFL